MIRNLTLAAAALALTLFGGQQVQAQHHSVSRAAHVHVSPARPAARPAAVHVHTPSATRTVVVHNNWNHPAYNHAYYGNRSYYTGYNRPWYHRGYYGGLYGSVYLSPLWGSWDYFNPGYYYDYTPSYYPVQPDYYSPPAGYYQMPGTTVSNYAPATANYSARIEVIVPDPQAQLWFNDQATAQQGTTRRFDTPALKMGSSYTYTIRAVWRGIGEMKTAERVVTVKAGSTVVVDFTE
jgi:uncharacterized protein (TIGR03000 family)